MDNLNDLKAIWQTANTSNLPQAEEIKSISKDYQQKTLLKKAWFFSCTLLATGLFTVSLFFYHPLFLSTRIGQFLVLFAMLILVWSNFKSLNRIYKIRNCSNQEFLQYLREVQQNRIIYYNKTQALGMFFYSTGLFLYLYELVYGSTFWTIFLYALAAVFLSFNWFYVRPKAYQKRARKFEPLLNHIEKLNKQLHE